MTVKNQNKKLVLLTAAFIALGFFVLSASTVIASTATSIDDLKEDIDAKRLEIDKINKKLEVYQKSLEQKRQEKVSLANELEILTQQIGELELKLQSTQLQIDASNLEIESILLRILDNEEKIDAHQNRLGEMIREIDRQDQRDILTIALQNGNLADFLTEVSQVKAIEKQLKQSLDQLKALRKELDERQAVLEQKNQELLGLKAQLAEQKAKLDGQESAKTYYLLQAKSSEKKFQGLIEEGKREQAAINNEIIGLEKTLRQRLSTGDQPLISTGRFIWPAPKNIITTYFYDPDYPFRAIFEHPGIDFRAAQGTTVRAADSGYVARAKNGGARGYSYIMIIHADGLSTVYGHMSKIYVAQDSYVSQGDVIGLSGGTPGTPGAGPFTTGPHMHFEVRQNGIPVDPLGYLP